MDLLHFDAAAFPLFAGMPYSETVLGPGDGIFIPRWTWHFVLAVDGPSARARIKELADDVSNGSNFCTTSSLDGSDSNDNIAGTGAGAGEAKKLKKKGSRTKLSVEADKRGGEEEEVPHCFSISFWWGDRREKRDGNAAHGHPASNTAR